MKISMSLVTIIGLAMPAAPGHAAEGEPRAVPFSDTATVVRVDALAGVLALRDDDDGREMQVRFDANTVARSGAKPIEIPQLQPGDRVVVSGQEQGETPLEPPRANRIELLVDRTPPVAP